MRVPGHQRKSYTWRWTAALAGLAVLVFALVMALVGTPSTEVSADARTWTVDRLDDPTVADNTLVPNDADGALDPTAAASACAAAANDCSLRGALWRANVNAGHTGTAAHTDTITFGTLSGSIALADSLPLWDAGPNAGATTVDGNPNWSVGVSGGFFPAFDVRTANNVIRDLGITGSLAGVWITGAGATGNRLLGNTISGNAVGVFIEIGANGNTVGGTDAIGAATAPDRNIIRGNGVGVGIAATAGTANIIRHNYIGTDPTGIVPAANGTGIADQSPGSNSILNNVICGNTGDGINVLNSNNDIVQGNLIGLGADRVTPLGNGDDGVDMSGTADGNLIGGTAAQGNTIVYSGSDGVEVTGPSVRDSIRRNSIFLNLGLGISTIAGGNDGPGNPVPPPGGLPVIDAVNFSGGQHVVSGHAAVAIYPSGSQVDVFKADPGGEGRQYLGSAVIFNDGANATWSLSVCGLTVGDQAVATATDNNGNTSQFSAPSSTIGFGTCIVAPTPTITTTPAATAVPAATNTTVPSATPSRTPTPAATATPTTAPTESVTLVAGCNPVASTYPDDTPTATIAGAVSPSTNLISIWWLDTANGRWLGYSPQFVAESDLTSVDRLEAIFICVSAASTWSRPQI